MKIEISTCDFHKSALPVEIKSAETFSPDFVKGVEHIKSLQPDRIAPGLVLYGGEQDFAVRDVRIFNPLHVSNLWRELTSPVE